MNREQIIEVLLSVRSREEGKGDRVVEAAFEQMDKDPTLRAIWEEQRQWDQLFKKSIHSIAVPTDLKQRILEQNHSSGDQISSIIPFPRYLWIPLAAAALVILSFIFFNFQVESESRDFARFEERAVDYTQGFFMLSKKTGQQSEVREWLRSHGAPHSFKIPFQIEGLSQLGCRQVKFCGISSSMICFEIEGKHQEVHLFIVDKSHLENLPPYGVPEVLQKKGNAVARWTDDNHGYILTGAITLEEMKSLF